MMVISTYNKLVKLKINVEEGFSTMDVYLKKRYDLIPNLVETVKGYEAYESGTLKEVVQARQQALSATNPDEVIAANQTITQGLNKLFALAEAYPDLKANTTYMELQQALKDIEADIANARLYYNGNVKIFNKAIVVFPTVILAGMLGFHSFKFFEADSSEREAVKIDMRK
jgi:LemA protein